LVIFTPSCILKARYVGRPKVMYFGDPVEDVGNTLYYGMASYRSSHFFYDGISQDFFVYSGDGLQSIGGPVISYFLANVTTNFELLQRTWTFVRPENKEVGWVFCSNTSKGWFDKAVIFNWGTKAWYTASVENIHSMGGFIRRVKTCDELTGTCDNLTGMIEDLGNTNEVIPRVWGSDFGYLLRENVTGDDSTNVLNQDTPVLETKDSYYDNLETVKESDTITVHATYTGPADAGVKVELSARKYIDSALNYVSAGVWTNEKAEGRLSFPRAAGRVFRWKFSFVDNTIFSPMSPRTVFEVEVNTNKEFGPTFKGQPQLHGDTASTESEGGL
jgi:hypothetical protein